MRTLTLLILLIFLFGCTTSDIPENKDCSDVDCYINYTANMILEPEPHLGGIYLVDVTANKSYIVVYCSYEKMDSVRNVLRQEWPKKVRVKKCDIPYIQDSLRWDRQKIYCQ